MIRSPLALGVLALLAALAAPLSSHAGYEGSISFTEEEIASHEAKVDQILQTAASCLEHDLAHHREFYAKYGISPYYGDRSAFSKLSESEKRSLLRSLGVNPGLLSQLEPTSCVGLALKCLGKGFTDAGADQAILWKRLRAYTVLNGVDGTALQNGLQKLGWKILYWNPDTRQNDRWDAAERNHNSSNSDHFWGYHQENWLNAKRNGRYLYNKVDDVKLLVDFGSSSPKFLKSIPFFVGTAHMGYHVFPGTFGNVVEAHSTRKINDPKSLQADPFNPLAGMAPTDGMYKSGLVAVPGKFLR